MLAKEMAAPRADPRTKRTRQLLMDAFGQLLSEKSFEAITVQDITERATVNRATFYAHFTDKYILLDQFMTEKIQHALRSKLPPDSQLNAANLQLLIQTVCEFLQQLHARCAPSDRNQFASLVEQQVKQQIYAILLHWFQESGARSPHPKQAELQATVTSWAIYGAAQKWSGGDSKESAAEFARQALPLIMAAVDVPMAASPKPKDAAKK